MILNKMPSFLTSLDQIHPGARVCLYGIGEGCLHFLHTLQTHRQDVEIVCLIDDSHKEVTTSIPIVSSAELSSFDFDLVLVTSAYWVDISKKIVTLENFEFKVVESSLLYKHMIFDDDELCIREEQFSQTSALLTGNSQKSLYALIVASRKKNPEYQQVLYDFFHANRKTMGREYLEYIHPEAFSTIIEGGVFDGSDTGEFIKLLAEDGTIYGFDPNLTSLNDDPGFRQNPKVRLYPVALWNSRATLNFFSNASNRPGARILADGETVAEMRVISAISIDEFIEEQSIDKVDFIKLDVEGAELEVLRGAVATLKNHRPQMAICIYHAKEHLFQIPLYLDSILENYHYHIGHYSPTFWDTVWYAVPDEIVGCIGDNSKGRL
ncbi:MAG: FkbM family methyltransferase [Geobacter sp.]|nr:FkbM family methyltransferase [Geobacter sp.]